MFVPEFWIGFAVAYVILFLGLVGYGIYIYKKQRKDD